LIELKSSVQRDVSNNPIFCIDEARITRAVHCAIIFSRSTFNDPCTQNVGRKPIRIRCWELERRGIALLNNVGQNLFEINSDLVSRGAEGSGLEDVGRSGYRRCWEAV